MNKILKLVYFFLISLFLFFHLSYSLDCLKISVEPVKDRITLVNDTQKDFLEFNTYFENDCGKDLYLNLVYDDFVYYVYFQPNQLVLPKDSVKKVNIKIYPPSYISSGWKAVRIKVYEHNKKMKEFYLKFYLKNPNYKVEVKKEYIYLIKTLFQNLDLLIEAPKEVKSWINKTVDFNVTLYNVNVSLLKKENFELIVFGKKGNKNLKLKWNYLNNLNNPYVRIEDNKIIFRNSFLADFSVEPGLYTLEAYFTLKGKNFEASERAFYNVLIEGSPYFIVEEKKEKSLFKTILIYKITNIGNEKGIYEFKLPLNLFKKLFISYDFEAKIENNFLIKKIELGPGESETLVITYSYTSFVIFILILIIAGAIYYYLNYYKPLVIKKDITKISISKDKKSFYIEVTIKNNSLKTFKDLVVLEKVSNGTVDELSVVPKYDYIKKDLSLSKIRWTIKELKPQERIKLLFKILAKDSLTVISYPTKIKTLDGKIYKGQGLKIYLKDNIKIEEFEEK
jgi:hypothetical protein